MTWQQFGRKPPATAGAGWRIGVNDEPVLLVRTVHTQARQNWLTLVYVAVVVTATLGASVSPAVSSRWPARPPGAPPAGQV